MIRLKARVRIKTLDTNAIRGVLEAELVDYLGKVKADFDKTILTWEHKPIFKVIVSKHTKSALIVRVSALSPRGAAGEGASPTDVYKFVTRGTAVRYAHMTSDFFPKTFPGYLVSGAGSGGLAYVDKGAPLPGIQARGWEEMIRDRHAAALAAWMQKALERGAHL